MNKSIKINKRNIEDFNKKDNDFDKSNDDYSKDLDLIRLVMKKDLPKISTFKYKDFIDNEYLFFNIISEFLDKNKISFKDINPNILEIILNENIIYDLTNRLTKSYENIDNQETELYLFMLKDYVFNIFNYSKEFNKGINKNISDENQKDNKSQKDKNQNYHKEEDYCKDLIKNYETIFVYLYNLLDEHKMYNSSDFKEYNPKFKRVLSKFYHLRSKFYEQILESQKDSNFKKSLDFELFKEIKNLYEYKSGLMPIE